MRIRNYGGVFAQLRDWSGRKCRCCWIIHAWTRLRGRLQRGDDLGDLVEMTGPQRARQTELHVDHVSGWRSVSVCDRLPNKWKGARSRSPVGPLPQTWRSTLGPCADHRSQQRARACADAVRKGFCRGQKRRSYGSCGATAPTGHCINTCSDLFCASHRALPPAPVRRRREQMFQSAVPFATRKTSTFQPGVAPTGGLSSTAGLGGLTAAANSSEERAANGRHRHAAGRTKGSTAPASNFPVSRDMAIAGRNRMIRDSEALGERIDADTDPATLRKLCDAAGNPYPV